MPADARRATWARRRLPWRKLLVALAWIVGKPIMLLGRAVVEILARGLAAAARVVSCVFALGVMIALLGWFFTHT